MGADERSEITSAAATFSVSGFPCAAIDPARDRPRQVAKSARNLLNLECLRDDGLAVNDAQEIRSCTAIIELNVPLRLVDSPSLKGAAIE